MIADVIRTANTEHIVYFLLTAYIQTVRFSGKSNLMPEPVTRLPLNGMTDVSSRFEKLMIELDTASKRLDDASCSLLREAMHIHGTALNRLRMLDGRSAPAPTGH